jgi:hypothetical protein
MPITWCLEGKVECKDYMEAHTVYSGHFEQIGTLYIRACSFCRGVVPKPKHGSHTYKLGLQVYVRTTIEITGVRVFLERISELWKIHQCSQ